MSDATDTEALKPARQDLPREYLGRARLFRNRLAVEDIQSRTAVNKIVTEFRARAKKNKPPRASSVTDAIRAWRDGLGSFGRLALEIDEQKSSLQIRELRLTAAQATFDNWKPEVSEAAVCVVLMRLQADSKTFQFTTTKLAGVGLHALARRYQRAFETSDEAIKKDLRTLADAATVDDHLALRDSFRIPASAGAGLWVGSSTVISEGTGHQRILSVRSFITE